MMKSPTGDRLPLQREEIEEGLVVYRCPQSGGVWIPMASYWQWLRKQPERVAHLPEVEGEGQAVAVSADDETVKLCPVSGAVMLRCKVGHGFDFCIERSAAGGIWLDGGEWEQLRARNFHDELHLMFAAPWQREVREEARAEAREARLRQRLGDEFFDRVQGLREELADHPARSEVLAMLMAD